MAPILGVTVGAWAHQAHENQMGCVQHGSAAHLAESGTGQKAGAVPGVHPNSRADASAGCATTTSALPGQHLPQWRTLHEELNGSVLAEF